MAARKKGAKKSVAKKKKSGFTPASRFLRYQITTSSNPNTETSHYIDIAKSLSMVNRRLYRQGKVYQIANISVTSRNTVDGLVSFSTAPDTWVTRAAWHRGFEIWNKMQNKVLDLPGQKSRKGRYNDFKVYLSEDMRATFTTNSHPRPMDNGNQLAVAGDWFYSEYQSPDGTTGSDEMKIHLLGGHTAGAGGGDTYTSVGLIKSYGEARATINKDNPLVDSDGDDDPLLNLFDDGTQVDEIAEDLMAFGDSPPYALTDGNNNSIGDLYPGSDDNMSKPVVNRLAGIGQQGAGIAPTVMLPGFTAICGLVEVELQSAAPDDVIDITIEIAPGSYKGVAGFDI